MRRAVWLPGALLVLLLALVVPGARGQQAEGGFDASATAEAVRFTVAAPGITVVNEIVDGGAFYADAAVSSLGVSRGFAANPDPGELVLSGPGLAAGLLALDLPFVLPQYPLAVASSYPGQPEAALGDDTFGVRSTSSARASSASATAGAGAGFTTGRFSSTATASRSDKGEVEAKGTATATGVAVGPLAISQIVSTASARATGPDDTDVSQTFKVTGAEVAGVPVTITPDGIEAAGTPAGLPMGPGATGEELTRMLAASGISVTLLQGHVDEGQGVATSPGVQIEMRQVLADGVQGVVPPGQVMAMRMILGRTFARSTSAGPEASTTIDPATGEETGLAPGDGGGSIAIPSDGLGLVAGTGLTAPDDTAGGRGAADTGGGLVPIAETLDPFRFYPVLVVAALAAFAALHVMRTESQRRVWQAVAASRAHVRRRVDG